MEAKADKRFVDFKLHNIARVRGSASDREYKSLEHLDGADPRVSTNSSVLYTDLPWGICLGVDEEDSLPQFDEKQDKIWACHIKSRDHKITFVFISDPKHPDYPHVFLTDGGITADKTTRGGLKILAPMGWHSFTSMHTLMSTREDKENLNKMLNMARKGFNDFTASSMKNSVDSDSTVSKSTDAVNVTKKYVTSMHGFHRVVGLRNINNELLYAFNAPTEKDVLKELGESGKRSVRSDIGSSALRILGHGEEEIALRGITTEAEVYRKQLSQAYTRWAEEGVFSVGLAQLNIDNDFHPVAKVLNDRGTAFDDRVERMLREYGDIVVRNIGADTGFSTDSFLENSLSFYKDIYEDHENKFTNVGGAKGCIPLTALINDTNGMTSEKSERRNPMLSRFFLEEFNRITGARSGTFDPTWLNDNKAQNFHTKLSGLTADLISQNYNRIAAFMKKKSERFAKEHQAKYHDVTDTMKHFYNIMKAYNYAYSKFDVTDEKTHGYFDRQERASDVVVVKEKQGGGRMLVGINTPTHILNKRVDEFFINKEKVEPPAFQTHYTLGSFARMLDSKLKSSHVRFVTPEGKVEDVDFEALAHAANSFINKPSEELQKRFGFSKQYVEEAGYQSFYKQRTDRELAELRKALAGTLGDNSRFYGDKKPANPYLKAQADMKQAVSALFGRLLPDANNNALINLGVFSIRDKTTAKNESFVFSRGREDQAGQLYKIVDNEYIVPVPATIQTDDSPYLQVVKLLKNYAKGETTPGYQMYFSHEGIWDNRTKYEVQKWAEDAESAINNVRKNVFLKEHLGALSAYAQMTESMSKLTLDNEPPTSIFKYDTFTVGQRTYSAVPKGPKGEEIKQAQLAAYALAKDNWSRVKQYIKLRMELEHLRNEEIRKTLPHASPETISVLTSHIETEQQRILAELSEMAPKMREAQNKFDNFVFTNPATSKLVDHFDRLTAVHDEYETKPGFFQQMVVDFSNVIDSAFNGFGKTIGAVIKALLNPAYAAANMADAAETALYSAVKTFFTVLFSGFVDKQFGDPKLKWMHAGAKQAMSGFNMKYMSESDMRNFHQTIAFDTNDKNPEAIERDRLLTGKYRVQSRDLRSISPSDDVYNRFVRVFGDSPTLEAAPEERSHAGPRRGGILFRWDIQDPEAAYRYFGLDINAALNDPYVLERWWRTESRGGIIPNKMLIPTNFFDITPTGGGADHATLKNRERAAMYVNENLRNRVFLSDSGKSLYIKAELGHFDLTPQQVYGTRKTTATEKGKARMYSQIHFDEQFNPEDPVKTTESDRPIRYRLAFD